MTAYRSKIAVLLAGLSATTVAPAAHAQVKMADVPQDLKDSMEIGAMPIAMCIDLAARQRKEPGDFVMGAHMICTSSPEEATIKFYGASSYKYINGLPILDADTNHVMVSFKKDTAQATLTEYVHGTPQDVPLDISDKTLQTVIGAARVGWDIGNRPGN